MKTTDEAHTGKEELELRDKTRILTGKTQDKRTALFLFMLIYAADYPT